MLKRKQNKEGLSKKSTKRPARLIYVTEGMLKDIMEDDMDDMGVSPNLFNFEEIRKPQTVYEYTLKRKLQVTTSVVVKETK